MLSLILIGVIGFAVALPAPDDCSNIIVINGYQFEEEVLKDGFDSPSGMSVDYNTNTLFFTTETKGKGQQPSDTVSINLNNGEVRYIEISATMSTAVDNKNHKVYMGGVDGIFEYNQKNKKVNIVGAENNIVWQIFIKNRIYFVDILKLEAFILDNGKIEKLKELQDVAVTQIAVDKNENIWFTNSSGLFVFNKIDSVIEPKGKKHNLNKFTTDTEGNLLFASVDGVYKINEDKNIEKIIDNSNIQGLTVDSSNNIIYSDKNKIVRLKPVAKNCLATV